MITVANIRQAIEVCDAGGTAEVGYDQASWCGTARCVLGHARIIAGVPEMDAGPMPGEIEDTPEGRTLARLMPCFSPDVLRVMRAVRSDGLIDLTEAAVRAAALRVASMCGADMIGPHLRWADLIGAYLAEAKRD